MNSYYEIETANICELADILTCNDCNNQCITIESIDEDGNDCYTEEAQRIYNKYYKLIETVLLYKEFEAMGDGLFRHENEDLILTVHHDNL